MPDWDSIFRKHGYFFIDPHPDMERIAAFFKENGVEHILDLGCGTGRHLVLLAKMGFQMEGFDSSSHALELCNRWLKEENLTANIIEYRMEQPFPYPNSFFDGVISTQVIHHNRIKDIQFTISEIARTLRPDGLIFITVPILGPKPQKTEEDWCLCEVEYGTYIPEKGPESGIPHHYFTEDGLLQAFHRFEPLELYIDASDHRCLLARKSR